MAEDYINIHETFASFFNDKLDKKAAKILSERLEEGSVAVPLNDENTFTAEEIKELKKKYQDREDRPFVVFNDKIYLQRYFRYETAIIKKIKDIIKQSENEVFTDDQKEQIKNFLEANFSGQENPDWQKIAVILGIISPFLIITGGPGTGKTTTVAKIISLLLTLNDNLRIALSAPTGKAAARLNESIRNARVKATPEVVNKLQNIEAKTIHRLLVFRSDSSFRYNEENCLPYDVIIVDESSMIDVALMSKLLNAVPTGAKVILLGDKDQLASVEAGSVFGDLCRSVKESENKFPDDILQNINEFYDNPLQNLDMSAAEIKTLSGHIVHLKKSYRFDSKKGIGKLSYSIINNKLSDSIIKGFSNCENKDVKICNDFWNVKDILKPYEEYIEETDLAKAFEKLGRIKILCALRNGLSGVDYYNSVVEKYLQKRGLIEIKPGSRYYHNQPVMMTQNDYANMIFNGDVGLVRMNEEDKLRVYFPTESGEIRSFDPNKLSGLVTVYAMTIHKSQGSEFNEVIVVLPDNADINILTRELLYTAVTRAKEKVTVITQPNVLKAMAGRGVRRSSGIEDRL